MISYLKGKLIEKSPTRILIENRGMGFSLMVSLTTSEQLGAVGEEVMCYTHLHHREDAMLLYGFASREERSLFELLISISGIGPKMAIGVFSGLPPQAFKEAVLRKDVARLMSAPGIGKKTAERLVLELRDKIGKMTGDPSAFSEAVSGDICEEAVMALVSLGFKPLQAEERVKKVLMTAPNATLEEMIRLALR